MAWIPRPGAAALAGGGGPGQAAPIARGGGRVWDRRADGVRGRSIWNGRRTRPSPGPPLLARLVESGRKVGIVTRNCRPAVERVLAATPLTHHVLLTRDDTPFVKPDARHLLAALAALGVAPEQAAMCGDHPMDVAAGRQAGTRTVGVLGLDGIALAFAAARPDLLVRSVAELGPVLGLDGE